ncbi:MAG: hypothetical protein U0Z75_05570 [Deinococcaceae bacterium]
MKYLLFMLVWISSLGGASALTFEGFASEVPQDARLGLFYVQGNGKIGAELTSTAFVGKSFVLEMPKGVPEQVPVSPITSDNIAWVGIVGKINLSAAVKGTELKLLLYQDTNKNQKYDVTEVNFDVRAHKGRVTLTFLYLSDALQVTADKGFSVDLPKGYVVLGIEAGRTIKGNVFSQKVEADLDIY